MRARCRRRCGPFRKSPESAAVKTRTLTLVEIDDLHAAAGDDAAQQRALEHAGDGKSGARFD